MKGRNLLICFAIMLIIVPKVLYSEVLNKIVAIVEDEVITLKELRERASALAQLLGPSSAETDLTITMEALEDLIEEKLAEKKSKELGIKITDAELDETIKRIRERNLMTEEELISNLRKSNMSWEDYRAHIKRQLLREKLINQAVTSKVIITEESVRNYYEKNKAEFQSPESVRISAIFIPLDQDNPKPKLELAQELVRRLRTGEKFEDIARQYSVGPGKDSGGDLGLFKVGELHPEVRKIVIAMKEGEVSNPFVAGNFVQILKVNQKVGGLERSFEEVKDLIREHLYQEELDKRFKKFVEELKSTSYVKVLN